MTFDGKTILVTGASSGIGRATAMLLAKRGANLVISARRQEPLDALADEIRKTGGAAAICVGDVANPDTAQEQVAVAHDRFGRLDGAFNNAGIIGEMAPLSHLSPENWDSVLRTNLTSAYHAVRYQVPALTAAGGGSIVFTGTFVGHGIGLPGMGAYAASKAGLIGLTEVLAVELGPQNIRVNCLLPGGTLTNMAPTDPQMQATIAGFHALKRMAQPEEIAAAAEFLLSDAASFVTGTALCADGGNSITKA